MYRKFTAIIQLMLMLVVVATSQPSLSYCLCAEEVCVGGCPCDDLIEVGSEASSCCSECEAHGFLNSEESDLLDPLSRPLCPDCLVEISINIEDFTLGSVTITESVSHDVNAPYVVGLVDLDLVEQSFKSSACGNGGSSRLVSSVYSVPLFVRYSVYLI